MALSTSSVSIIEIALVALVLVQALTLLFEFTKMRVEHAEMRRMNSMMETNTELNTEQSVATREARERDQLLEERALRTQEAMAAAVGVTPKPDLGVAAVVVEFDSKPPPEGV